MLRTLCVSVLQSWGPVTGRMTVVEVDSADVIFVFLFVCFLGGKGGILGAD